MSAYFKSYCPSLFILQEQQHNPGLSPNIEIGLRSQLMRNCKKTDMV